MTADIIQLRKRSEKNPPLYQDQEDEPLPQFFFECLEAFKENGYKVKFVKPDNQNTKNT